ncbi:MAG: hypothetical protein J6Y36_00520 [Treponema sp.]|uniref:hypothetical protein n=1 Tax=Treponema sp. TaxID=166 RepID=UPI001B74C9BE|nr:hypothetical protein [Treponema sp.]MBP5401620.1 hypothetical protein [Treponema sp.]MBR5932868.1 hypothetical protein [Treponema sp.]
MDRRIPALILITYFLLFPVFSQNLLQEKKIRLYIWALQDAYPEFKETYPHEQAITHLRSASELLLTGMTYGYRFTYTPSDKLRNVDEYFECVPVKNLDEEKKNIEYEKTYWREDKIFCWVNFERTEQMIRIYKRYSSIKTAKVTGTGKGKLSKGYEGLEEATRNAVKNGIREYYRKIIKNKPKEITGTILIRQVPAVLINSGYYVVELDFFLETGKIKEYSQF